jgi:6-phosphogluconolactonase/glucosamine-6-phosphate isomerase/deaminase
MIKFYKIKQPSELVEWLSQRIDNELRNNKSVLWLIPGGSAMNIAVAVAKKLQTSKNASKLTLSLTDERYGPLSHKDSNWQQLIDKNFSLAGAKLLPVLGRDSFENTAQNYSEMLTRELLSCDYSLALAGMGPDGHIFGIKPHSPAISSQRDVIGYEWDDYNRLTPTFNLIRRLDEVVIYAVGTEKHQQLDKLEEDLSAEEQPAQLLKKLQRVTIFNDYKGESI